MLDLTFGESVGRKFNSDRTVRHFPGNTIVCVLDHSTEVYERARALRDEIVESPMGSFIAPLPDESLHMTAIEGVCDQVRVPELWTKKLPLNAPLVDVDDFLEEQWKDIPELKGVHMTFDSVWAGSGICIGLYPASYSDDVRIRDWRDSVADSIGIRFPGHDRYRFHISLAYGIIPPSIEAIGALESIIERNEEDWKRNRFTFEVPSPSLTYFNDMFYFNKNRIPR